jgi:hypothetical protein
MEEEMVVALSIFWALAFIGSFALVFYMVFGKNS